LRIKLKKSVLVKQSGASGSLVLDSETDHLFQFSGDVAKMMVILFEQSGKKGLSLEEVRNKLADASVTFKKNKQQQRCIAESVKYLREMKLLEG
jgi:hypothetical protein